MKRSRSTSADDAVMVFIHMVSTIARNAFCRICPILIIPGLALSVDIGAGLSNFHTSICTCLALVIHIIPVLTVSYILTAVVNNSIKSCILFGTSHTVTIFIIFSTIRISLNYRNFAGSIGLNFITILAF